MLTACSPKTDAPPTTSGKNGAPSTYRVGTDASSPPFSFQNDKGDIVGFDVEVLTAAASKAGLKLQFINTPWDSLIASLQQGDRDILASAIAVSEEREQTLDFSAPYFETRPMIAVPEASNAAGVTDLKGLRVGVQAGSPGDGTLSELDGKAHPGIVRFETTQLALQALDEGKLDAALADSGSVLHYRFTHPQPRFKALPDPQGTTEAYAIAVRKGNAELLDKINKGLADIKADGTYQRIRTKYFGPPSLSVPPAASGAEGPTGR